MGGWGGRGVGAWYEVLMRILFDLNKEEGMRGPA